MGRCWSVARPRPWQSRKLRDALLVGAWSFALAGVELAAAIVVNPAAPTQPVAGDAVSEEAAKGDNEGFVEDDDSVTEVGGKNAVWFPRIAVTVLLGLLLVIIIAGVSARFFVKRRRLVQEVAKTGNEKLDGAEETGEAVGRESMG